MEESASKLSGSEKDQADLSAKMDAATSDLNKEKRKVEELELELDMLNAEKSQLSAKVGKISGAKFQSAMFSAKSATNDLR